MLPCKILCRRYRLILNCCKSINIYDKPWKAKPNNFPNVNFNNLLSNNFRLNLVATYSIHTTAKRYNPIVSTIVRQVVKVATMFTARAIRKWYKNLPIEKRKLVFAWLAKHKKKFFILISLVSLSIILYYQSHIQETPITKRRRFIAFTPEQFKFINKIELEVKLQQFSDKLLRSDDPTTLRVAKVAKQLISRNKDIKEIKNHEWTVSVIDNPEVMNAFVLPSGNIFVYSGLLKLCENDHQLGIILSHEISHAILAHGEELASHAHIVDLLFIGLLGIVWMFFPTDMIAAIGSTISKFVINIMMETPYNKMLEIEADEVGLNLAAKACFDIREASVFWDKMNYIEKANMTEIFGTPDPPVNLDFLSTHPSHKERSKNLEKLIESALRCRSENNCPPLPKIDPREKIKNSKTELVRKEIQSLFKITNFKEL